VGKLINKRFTRFMVTTLIFSSIAFSPSSAFATSTLKPGFGCSHLLLNKTIRVHGVSLTCKSVHGKLIWVAKTPKKVVGSISPRPTPTPTPTPLPNNSQSNLPNPTPSTSPIAPIGKITASAYEFNVGAAHVIDVYEDMQCPYCAEFEGANGSNLDSLINSGNYQVNFHLVAFLGDESILAGNATLCAAESGHFLDFHNYLFANQQPVENFGIWNNTYFLQLGKALNITDPNFSNCLTSVKYQSWLATQTQSTDFARTNSTPSLYLDNKLQDNTAIAFNKNGFETLFGLNVV